ncbi:mannitol dehydrogenase family protein [Clostridium sp. AL.422]|uniref:mannitol dehydrogenase family protein n=1 Tax=Clostridium TaxID=1485 RepID=UPI00293DE496|nr:MULTISPECIES: mannitol dehydrogenase family protein [unclassified Clostridium]MDV4151556.1 mannitol dehydrogenase family protein [Clostridium sp. AL.422]
MQLTEVGLCNRESFEKAGYILPNYDRQSLIKNTKENPKWIHFGSGNIFRAFQANLAQNLINDGLLDTGLIVAEGYDYEIIEKINNPHDNYSILVTLKSDGAITKTIIGSVVESLMVDSTNKSDFFRLKEIFQSDSLQIASFTITEKGYSLIDGQGNTLPSVLKDIKNGPENPESYIGKIVSLLYTRYSSGEKPIAMVSMDNCSNNGFIFHNAVLELANKWYDSNLVEKEFINYINNNDKVSFPWTMIDKITPRPSLSIESLLKEDGLVEIKPIVTEKNTFIAPFVNAEESEYLIIEDTFPNGRPPLEKAGVIFTTRENVEKVEKMKVCTCLNPLHTALAIFGCILNYDSIAKEMENSTLRKLVEYIGYNEGLPVVVNPDILDPKDFIDTVLKVRLTNPFIPDTPQRIATDTSQKLAIRFGETIKEYYNSQYLDVSDLKFIPLVLAGWLRYLMAIDDNGNKFELSPDPMLYSLTSIMSSINIGDNKNFEELLMPILKNKKIFGADLYEVNMASTVCNYFKEMVSGIGAVKATLEKYV